VLACRQCTRSLTRCLEEKPKFVSRNSIIEFRTRRLSQTVNDKVWEEGSINSREI
jgi:hypothetical protein